MQRGGLSRETKQQQTEVKRLPLTHPVRGGAGDVRVLGRRGVDLGVPAKGPTCILRVTRALGASVCSSQIRLPLN